MYGRRVNLCACSVNNASVSCIQRSQYPGELWLQQRMVITLVPVSTINCTYDSRPFEWWIFGSNHDVSADNYPAQCCCGLCVIA